jgi:hypothetical protein
MRLSFHPLHPLTQTGGVIVCIAAAVFAALLLIAWEPLQADELKARPSDAPLTCARAAR